MTASTARMSAATGASKAVAEDWDKMRSPFREGRRSPLLEPSPKNRTCEFPAYGSSLYKMYELFKHRLHCDSTV
jgi:hypothetical protein